MQQAQLSYEEMLDLQWELNKHLRAAYLQERSKGREHLSKHLIALVEELVDGLNSKGHRFGRCEYGGATEFESSEQFFSNGAEPGEGVILHFIGFSVQVSWEGDHEVA
ncbi:MAG: hypothetical protein P1U67_05185 [Alcanivoracaceae bacterium]|nr:hypothetical protein [Alcanivoracaceae bacterium]